MNASHEREEKVRKWDLPEPVFDGCGMTFVLLGDEEPDKFRVAHARLAVQVGVVGAELIGESVGVRGAPSDGAGEYPIDHLRRERCPK